MGQNLEDARRRAAAAPMGLRTLAELAETAAQRQHLDAGKHLYWRDEPFAALFLVESGTLKTYNVDLEGDERVRSFHLPGELLGMDGIADGSHRCNAAAVEPATVLRLPFDQLLGVTSRVPALQAELLRSMAREYGIATSRAGDHGAEQRIAAFLLDMVRRSPAAVGGDGPATSLAMPRRDIASYLRLAPETVSRTVTRFRCEGLIRGRGRLIELADPAQLEAMARPVLNPTVPVSR